jgi:hypothetical protein
MSRIHWVARENKLETPKEKDEVNKREVHECDGRARDPDTMSPPGSSSDPGGDIVSGSREKIAKREFYTQR